jgi:DNA-binding response OmpR family regulator
MERASSFRPLIMIAEDHPLIVEFMEAHLRRNGFDVIVAQGCAATLQLLRQHRPALLILEAVLEDGLGYDLCRTVRSGGEDGALARIADLPILMLSTRADESDRLEGFRAGADDYVVKPFSPDELVCRIRAILRRSFGLSSGLIELGPLRIHPRKREACVDDQVVDLTPKEFDLLHLLTRNPGRVFSREDLLQRIWRYSYLGNSRTVDVHVNRLRQKLMAYGLSGDAIGTERGVGYKLVLTNQGSSALAAAM